MNHEDASAPLRFRDRLLDYGSLEFRYRILVGIIVAQVAVTCLLVILAGFPAAELVLPHESMNVRVSLIHYVFTVLFLWTSLTVFVFGMAQAHPRGIGLMLLLFAAIYLLTVLSIRPRLNDAVTFLVTIIFVFVFCFAVAAFYTKRIRSELDRTQGTFIIFLALIGPTVTIYQVSTNPSFFVTMLFFLVAPFTAIFYMAAIDWAEMMDSFAGSALSRLNDLGGQKWIKSITVAVCLLTIIWVSAEISRNYVPVMSVFGLFFLCAAAVVGVLRIAGFRGQWGTQFPWVALVLVIIVFVVLIRTAGALRWDRLSLSLLFVVAMAIALFVCGRHHKFTHLAPTALFGMLVGLGWAVSTFTLNVLGDLPAICIVSLGNIAAVCWAFRKGLPVEETREPVRLLLGLNLSLLGLLFIAMLYHYAVEHSEHHMVEAAVVALAILGELALSGHSITNAHSAWFPRASRLLMYFGFIGITLTVVLLLAAFRIPAGMPEAEVLVVLKYVNNPEVAVLIGLLFMAPAMVWTLFILRMGKWLFERRIRYADEKSSSPAHG